MIKSIGKNLKNLLRPYFEKYFGYFLHGRFSYAQEGEDLVVFRLLEGKRNGFYVEVGCHHPYRFSNTYIFYKNGWRGVCIDPLPGTKNVFNRKRPRDIVVEVGVGEDGGILHYYMFNEPALNTFDSSIAKSRDGLNGYFIKNTKTVEVKRLDEILNAMLELPEIDLLSVDVEGFDLQVLKSNDWNKYRPRVIIAECLAMRMEDIMSDSVCEYLTKLNYSVYAKTGHSVIFLTKS